jgi:signal peptidase I
MSPSPYTPPTPDPPAQPKPSAIVAGILTLFCGLGLGHVYAGRTARGLAWAVAPFVVLFLLAGLVHGAHGLGPLLGGLLLFVAVMIGAIADAARTARRSPARASMLRIVLFAVGLFVFGRSLAVAARYFVVEAFKIPAGSMMPTLVVGDHLFVDKTRKGGRGEVIVFPFPEHPEQDFVKRIVGLPGERLEFHDGHPRINGVDVPKCRVGTYAYDEEDAPSTHVEGDVYVEVLDGHPYLAFYEQSGFTSGDQGPYVVQPGEVFVLGDNRNRSHDSRMWNGGVGGGVPASSVRGVPIAVWLSVNDRGVDWSRFGHAIDDLRAPGAPDLDPKIAQCLADLHIR